MSANKGKKFLPLIVVVVVVVAVIALIFSAPKPEKRNQNNGPKISVEVMEIQRTSITPRVLSYGLVEPRVRSKLVAQVGGRIEQVSERFRDGGFFRKGELLLQIDSTDYEIELDIAEASLAEAEQRLAEERAQAEQAKIDWSRLGNTSPANSLVMREPQLKAAEANVSSAKAQLKKAKINLQRTSIQAPFDGRVLSTSVDLGQVVSSNTVLGEIYATDAVEIRLPVKNNEIALLDLPESYRHQDSAAASLPSVRIRSELAGEEVWQGSIVRTAGSIDDSSRQLYVVARIDDPFGKKAEGRFPLKIGQYVTAEIDGIAVDSAITIPNKAVYQGSYVYLYKQGAVYRTPIEIDWQNGEMAIVSEGISPGDQLVVSPLGQVASGTLVKLTGAAAQASEQKIAREAAKEPAAKKDEMADKTGEKKGAAI